MAFIPLVSGGHLTEENGLMGRNLRRTLFSQLPWTVLLLIFIQPVPIGPFRKPSLNPQFSILGFREPRWATMIQNPLAL